MGTGAIFQGVKLPVLEADHSFPFSTDFNLLNAKLNPIWHLLALNRSRKRVKNKRTLAATHTYVFMFFRGTSLLFNFSYCVSDCRSQWPCGLRRASAAACLLVLWVRIPPRAWMFVCCEYCVLSSRDLCVGLITGPEDSYRLWCV